MRGVAVIAGVATGLITLAATLFAIPFTVAGILATLVGLLTLILVVRQDDPDTSVSIGAYVSAGVFVLGSTLAAWRIQPVTRTGLVAEILSIGRSVVIGLFVLLALIATAVGYIFQRKE